MACEKCGGCREVSEFSTEALKNELGARRRIAEKKFAEYAKVHAPHWSIVVFVTYLFLTISATLAFVGLLSKPASGSLILWGLTCIPICLLGMMYMVITSAKLRSKFAMEFPNESAKL